MNLVRMSATGNTFAVVDGFLGEWPDDPAAAARELCRGAEPLDGLLLVGRPRSGGQCVMEVWNSDGSRAETCGNGLRCVGRLMVERGHVPGNELVVETDAGPRALVVRRRPDGGWAARAELGRPVLRALELRLQPSPPRDGPLHLEAVAVDLGNPHCVVFVEDEKKAAVAELGPLIERNSAFPGGTNVAFAAPRGRQMGLRVWERGVGETLSCGSGACAAAAAAIQQGRVPSPVEVEQAGGWLLVEWDRAGSVWLTGPIEESVAPWPSA